MAPLAAVTGATGFVGQHLVRRLLAEGWRVRVLARRLPWFQAGPAGPVELVLGDLGDEGAVGRLVDGAEAVLHLAGLIKARDRAAFLKVNRDGVVALRRAAMAGAAPGMRFILLSSLTARAPGLSDYGASKRAGEQVLEAPDTPFSWVAVRAPAVYGPEDRETLEFFRLVARGWAPLAGRGQGRVSAIHVEDLVALLVLLAAGPLPPPDAYEADDGTPGGYSLREFAMTAAQHLGVRPLAVPVPRAVMMAVAGANRLRQSLGAAPHILSMGKVREIYHADWARHDRRLEELTGWRPSIDLSSGFARTIAWYKSRKWL